ncbi:MAG: hypothetical protein AMXMBFR84_45610 [Candidatus Hydrogenedentota bacterium]
MATLILFDIDGTLAATSEADNRCFAKAFEQTFGQPIPTTDWHAYTHVTDIGILGEISRTQRGTELHSDEIESFRTHYAEQLRLAAEATPHQFAEVPGARKLMEHLAISNDFQPGIATGGFRLTALFKLRNIGIDGLAYPAAFADDAISRADIVRTAIARSGGPWDDAVYIGDGLWDMYTAATLDMRFIGITHETGPERFQQHGVTATLESYACLDTFWRAVEQANVPRH